MAGIEADGRTVDISATQSGTDDFEQLYRRWRADAVALCRRLLGRFGDAEDAAQEAFLRAWVARDQYSSTKPFWPWLSTIARRLCVDSQRRGAREVLGQGSLDVDVVEITPEGVVVAAADLEIVFEAIGELRGRDKRALLLRELGGWSYERIAAEAGVSVESVRGSLKRTRASLRQSVLHADVFGVGLRADDQAGAPGRRRLSSG